MDSNLLTHYVNSFEVRQGPSEIHLTLGIINPELEKMLPMFQCVMTKDRMCSLIDALQSAVIAYTKLHEYE